ncbi:hypothetical protein IWQ60_005000 [Tieghemiomyces parasiticus]|uniref:Rhodanese domain-containing protein n=1 Tax=Tieghemiomyces parasiticus TaxID=78921 RepID=A0A9W8AAD6_9FUNG|nr:hypothetical protein IWQ60_005000 [Tieghemiomyces parasiticus]
MAGYGPIGTAGPGDPFDSEPAAVKVAKLLTWFPAWRVLGQVTLAPEGIDARLECPPEHLADIKRILENSRVLHPKRYEWDVAVRTSTTAGKPAAIRSNSFTSFDVEIRPLLLGDGRADSDNVCVHDHWATHLGPAPFDRRIRLYLLALGAAPELLPQPLSSLTNPVHAAAAALPSEPAATRKKVGSLHPRRPTPWILKLPTKVNTPAGDIPPGQPCLFDLRSRRESAAGRFAGARELQADSYSQIISALDRQLERVTNRDGEILLYCTTGLRATKAGAYLLSRGFSNVHVLKGGVTAYERWATKFAQPSLFVGKNITFNGYQGGSIAAGL